MKKKILLVEGNDDVHVIKNICGNLRIGPFNEIKDAKGREQLLQIFPVQAKASDIGSLGIVIDADLDVESTWKSVRDKIISLGYRDCPISPLPEGTIIEPMPCLLLPKIGIWIMPDNRIPGMLEDFIQFLIPEDDQLFCKADSTLHEIPNELIRFSPQKRSKALIHTWLAWQAEPGKPLGQAITARYLSVNEERASPFISWLKTISEISPQE